MSVVWKLHCVVKESKNNILDECLFATVSLCVRELVCGWVCVCVCAKVVCKPVFIHSREKTRSNHRIVLWFLFVSLLKFSSFLCFAFEQRTWRDHQELLVKNVCLCVWMCFFCENYCGISVCFLCIILSFLVSLVCLFCFLYSSSSSWGHNIRIMAWRGAAAGYF